MSNTTELFELLTEQVKETGISKMIIEMKQELELQQIKDDLLFISPAYRKAFNLAYWNKQFTIQSMRIKSLRELHTHLEPVDITDLREVYLRTIYKKKDIISRIWFKLEQGELEQRTDIDYELLLRQLQNVYSTLKFKKSYIRKNYTVINNEYVKNSV